VVTSEAGRAAEARVLSAMSHPVRRRLLQVLTEHGPSTASQLAARTGQAVANVSHHVRVLASCRLVEEAPELARDRRERWWRLASDAGGRFSANTWLRLTAAEVAELSAQITDLLDRWSTRDIPGDGVPREPVFVFAFGTPSN
jgi:DNA-binding transcriptional ArsR family regulator